MTLDWSKMKDDETHDQFMAKAIVYAAMPIVEGEDGDLVMFAIASAMTSILIATDPGGAFTRLSRLAQQIATLALALEESPK